MPKTLGVGIIGYGTVGSGVAALLCENRSRYLKRLGVDLRLKAVVTRHPGKVEKLAGVSVGDDLESCIRHDEIHVVVETMGGMEPARTYIAQTLKRHKHVVTANKAVIANFGQELFALARENRVSLCFEASCAGSIPVIAAIRERYASDRITSIRAILNGTCNYILTRMGMDGCPFGEALDEARSKGYAEADPSMDVNGTDSAHKLAILASLAFGCAIPLDGVYCEGIEGMDASDIRFAWELGYRVKLLAIARSHENGELELRVHPALVPADDPLASVSGVYNAVMLHGKAVGQSMLYGQGAGKFPTASAVVSDILDVALGRSMRSMQHVDFLAGRIPPARVRPARAIRTRYYVRFPLVDRPGVLAEITGVLGKYHIGIASVMQKENSATEAVPVIVMTYQAQEANFRSALAEISKLDVVRGGIVFYRVAS